MINPKCLAIAAALLLSVGCGGSSDLTDAPPATQLTLTASPSAPETGSPVTFTVTAHSAELVIKSVTIDFDNDGNSDDVRLFDQASVVATFTHTFDAAGAFTVRTEVKDSDNVSTFASLIVIVETPASPPVSYRVSGISGVNGGACFAHGPPIGCAGCFSEIPAAGITRSLGSLAHGSPVALTQEFTQNRLVDGTLSTSYACAFSVVLLAGTAGSEVPFGQGTCATTSFDPEQLTCSVTATGTVP